MKRQSQNHLLDYQTTILHVLTDLRTYFRLLLCLLVLSQMQVALAQLQFEQQSQRTEVWREAYMKVPTIWKAQMPIHVMEVSNTEMKRYVEQFQHRTQQASAVVDGYYQGKMADSTPARIVLIDSLARDNGAFVFTHEYGHYVWSELLDANERLQYQTIWSEQKTNKRLITDYASTNEEEGFAEAFAYYLRNKSALRHKDERSYQFLLGIEKTNKVSVKASETHSLQ